MSAGPAGVFAIDWAVAARPYPGESESGDACVVEPLPGGVLLAVVDGLGHGPDAAEAARRAVDALRDDPERPPAALLRHCHSHLAGTRGAAVTVVVVNAPASRLEWLGVGNVEAAILPEPGSTRSAALAPLSAGIVGQQLPTLKASTMRFDPGERLALATDGLVNGAALMRTRAADPAAIADELMERCWRETDDALVLVARLPAAGPPGS